ncbi:MAG: DNA topoisomerase I [Candidatus Schekmanbacteria bacterium RIFCSPLOWO2_12_FULL_38_15]|uniref:DNA topoisomerase 1 n=1 Tax=Candidatus Schekmanbacteria bacterium RIFCSPLOWO2_12_FULL_38_15 TaxID=1817883 RepID=A0A1F7SI44_9BACT|nr:MAG: DNA topoisomerase I [Candidatus Schekmanbacteria bacterium RIFCSPLOWO2_12_FULL_38_15]
MSKKSLVIVESPAKAKTINKFLGKSFVVIASVGHVKDLPKSKLGVDVENDFQPSYEILKSKTKVISELKEAAKDAEKIYLAPDPDREGEAIAWHIAEEIGGNRLKIFRVLFNEITERAVLEAIKNPSKLDKNKFEAQQARRILDRLVGYEISPLLWKKVRYGLSAGRVQSVAVRLICEREKEIKAFVPEEYWSITAELSSGTGVSPVPFKAKLVKRANKKLEIKNNEDAEKILKNLEGAQYVVTNIETKERKRNPLSPFITSKLQQDAARKLGFTAKKTMMLAQQLYEGVELGQEGSVGLITYMRTDSTRIADEAIKVARTFIEKNFGKEYLPAKPTVYPSKKNAQGAHEAIRPTYFKYTPNFVKPYLGKDHFDLYQLIWNRFIACQMAPVILDQTTIQIEAGKYLFQAIGSVIKFPGFMAVYTEAKEEEEKEEEEGLLPALSKGEILKLLSLTPQQHFTQSPPRFTEASLVKELEENGIGRPSTYAAILSTIQERKYSIKEKGKFIPTELGFLITDLLIHSFPNIVDVKFTAHMEEELDEIEEGKLPWLNAMREFYEPFKESMLKAKVEMKDVKKEETPTDIKCEKCGKPMVIKWGRNGKFLACSNYPECKNTKNFTEDESGKIILMEEKATGEKCEKCGGDMVVKSGRYGKFLACEKYPECRNTRQIIEGEKGSVEVKEVKMLDEKCPQCGSQMAMRNGRYGSFIACSGYPKCKFIKQKVTGVKCHQDGCNGELVEKISRKGIFYSCSNYPNCKFALWDKPIDRNCPKCKSQFLVEKLSRKNGVVIKCIAESCDYEEKVAENVA